MTSEGYWVRFSRVPERSLNCLPHARQRKRRQPWAVRSGRSVTASDPQSKHRILARPLRERRPYTHPSPRRPGVVARALTEPLQDHVADLPAVFVTKLDDTVNTSLDAAGLIEHEAHREDDAADECDALLADDVAPTDFLHARKSPRDQTQLSSARRRSREQNRAKGSGRGVE